MGSKRVFPNVGPFGVGIELMSFSLPNYLTSVPEWVWGIGVLLGGAFLIAGFIQFILKMIDVDENNHKHKGVGEKEQKTEERIDKKQETEKPVEQSPSFKISINREEVKYDDYERILAITVQNLEPDDLEKKCLVQLDRIDGVKPDDMPFPLVLRTEGQTHRKENKRFTLSTLQGKTVPILFRNPNRKNEWYFFDELGKSYFIPAREIEMEIGIYGGKRKEKIEFKYKKSTDEDDFQYFAELIENNNSPSLKPEITISEAIDHLINILFPDIDPRFLDLDNKNEYPKAFNMITAKLRTGELKSWGLYVGESVEREFDKDVWEFRELMPLWASVPNETNPQTKSVLTDSNQQQLTGLRVNFNQVKSLWPEK